MNRRLSEFERKKKYSRYAEASPLNASLPDSISKRKPTMKSLGGIKLSRRDFVLDGVREHTNNFNVLSSYNALNDPHAQTYFRQPAVQDMLKRAAQIGDGQLVSSQMQTFKLSQRRRMPATPGVHELYKKESRFVIDSVKTDSLKSKRNPVIPKYDAMQDGHARRYFQKRSVRDLLRQTCGVKY